MRKNIRLAIIALAIAALCLGLMGLAGCSPTIKDGGNTTSNTSNSNSNYIGSASSGLVAATIDGTPIYEDTITNDIQQMREDEDLMDSFAWNQWMGTNGYTAATVRDSVIDQYVSREAVKIACKERGLTADEDGITNSLNTIKGLYTDQAAWEKALANAGYTEETYRAELEQASLEQALMDQVAPSDSSDEQQELFADWLETYKYTLNVVIYEMPSGLPYAS